MQEYMLFNSDNVFVSNNRFIVDGQTYEMGNVTSVKVDVEEATVGTGIFIALIGTLVLFSTQFTYSGGIILLIGILSFLAAKNRYSIVLSTSSGQGNVLFSKDINYIEKIVSALNEAIVSRG